MSYRLVSSSPGKYSGQDNGWVLSLIYPALIEFDKSIIEFPRIRRFPGGASTDLRPNLQDPRRTPCPRSILLIRRASTVAAAEADAGGRAIRAPDQGLFRKSQASRTCERRLTPASKANCLVPPWRPLWGRRVDMWSTGSLVTEIYGHTHNLGRSDAQPSRPRPFAERRAAGVPSRQSRRGGRVFSTANA